MDIRSVPKPDPGIAAHELVCLLNACTQMQSELSPAFSDSGCCVLQAVGLGVISPLVTAEARLNNAFGLC